MTLRKFRRVPDAGDRWLGGVCAGLAYAVGIPAWVIRIVFVLTVLFYGFGNLPYLLLWVFLPEWSEGEPADYDQVAGG